MKGDMATSMVHAPPGAARAAKSNAKVSPANIEQHVSTSAAPRAPAHASNSAPSSKIAPESGQELPEGFIHLFCIFISIIVVFFRCNTAFPL